ncbi:FecR family protein [Chitinophaga cymbidii]|uniref:Anti-sigma factor n=1 Tax=Chitinophaga cymbidii TaxID=1096750 RepID=A0A512RM39_9BACT|nr:FecR family protein [Chitinophaga cymbidii]GEP96764.1 anti-sigma factor [Chitinophaga cymbidii]
MEPQKYPGAKALLEKFHAGKCTPEELALLDEWYESLGKEHADGLSTGEATAMREAFLNSFRGNLPQSRVFWLFRPAVKRMLAASVVLTAGLAVAWIYARRTPPAPSEKNTLLVQNGSGAIKKVILPDSSEVWLNANASLRWEEDPAKQERHLALTGEGFFDVQNDSRRPFIIHTRDLTIRVLGTTFSVEAYPGEKMSRVSLLSGKVQVHAKADNTVGAILRPGYAAKYTPGDTGLLVAEEDMKLATTWKEGGFTASGLSVHDAMVRLCEKNGYSVRWMNKKDIEKNITVAFPPQSFEKMLGNLCYMNHKRFSISGKQVTIY